MEIGLSTPNLFACTVLRSNSSQCNALIVNSDRKFSTAFASKLEKPQLISDIPRIRKPELQIPNDFQVVNQVPFSSDRREITVTSASTGTEQVFLTSLPDAKNFEFFGVEFKNISGIDLRPLLVESGLNIDENITSNLQQFKVSFANNAVSEISLADGSSAVFAAGKIILRSPNGQEIEKTQISNTSIPHHETIANYFNKANKANLLAQNSSCKATTQSSLENVVTDISNKQAALQSKISQNSQSITVYVVVLDFISSMLANRPISTNLQETICKPPVQCNEQVVAGRSEIRTDLFQVPENANNKSVSLEYEFFNIPDKLEMLYDGKKIFEVGPISGSDRKVFALPNTAKLVGVRVIGNRDKQTEWNYKISCTGDAIAQKPIQGTPLRYLAINVGNSGVRCFLSSEVKLCDVNVVNRLREYIAYWNPDVIMFSEIKRASQLTSAVDGGPVLPKGYDGVCGLSVDRFTQQPVAWNAENASHEHECIAWKTSRVTPLPGARKSLRAKLPVDLLSAYGRNDEYGRRKCDYDFTGFRAKLLLENKIPITAVAVHPNSINSNCRTEEIGRYWTTLANKGNVIIGGDWNTNDTAQLQVPSTFKVNYSFGNHWNIATHPNEITSFAGLPRELDHAFSNFGQACINCGSFYGTEDLPFGSALGGYHDHPQADGGGGMDHRQILVDMMIP